MTQAKQLPNNSVGLTRLTLQLPGIKPRSGHSTVPEPRLKSRNPPARKRWTAGFVEQRGNKRVPKRLDIANELLVTPGGPLKMTGNITLINEDGSVTHSNNLSLCRCGASKTKPLCDDQHLDIDFFDGGAVYADFRLDAGNPAPDHYRDLCKEWPAEVSWLPAYLQ